MPLLGALVGSLLYTVVRSFDHWVAFGLLEAVGINMLVEGAKARDASVPDSSGPGFDPSCGWPLLGLSVATSIDAFGAGMGMRLAGVNVWPAAAVIATVTVCLTYLGARLGRRARRRLGPRAEMIGGLVLIALGFNMLKI